MATILGEKDRDFREDPNKADYYRLFSDTQRTEKGVNPENLNFDLRRLNPGQFSSKYHFHRYAEELFVIISGTAMLRTPTGKEEVKSGDIIFFEKGPTGAHQLYNHTGEPCIFLDVRTFIGYDVAEYPDNDKILLIPSFEILQKKEKFTYHDVKDNLSENWADEMTHTEK